MIHDLIYLLEITDVDDLEFTNQELVYLGTYLIRNLTGNHSMPGKVYFQMIGICDWYRENQFLTDKQRYWMMDHLKEYINQRDFANEI
jgi:hypothetical protein